MPLNYPPEPIPLFLTLHNVEVRKFDKIVLQSLDWDIRNNEQWAIVGANGAGKTCLAEVIAGKGLVVAGEIHYHFRQEGEQAAGIELVSTAMFHALVKSSAQYYQQRFNSLDSESSPLVREILLGAHPSDQEKQVLEAVSQTFGIAYLLDRRLIKLSNGETKRVLIAKALIKKPVLLILDSPFVGLDTQAREVLRQMIDQIAFIGTRVLLVASTAEELPESITHVLQLEKGKITAMGEKASFLLKAAESQVLVNGEPLSANSFFHFCDSAEPAFQTAVQMNGVSIAYNETKILDNIHWTVQKGEKWALLGPNGSGKSTLLSLINGDNPQAYANDIVLFDRKRGTGESIWDIKKQIGFVSPELHLYYPMSVSCSQVVASGYFDRIGQDSEAFQRTYTELQQACTQACLALLGIQHLAEQPLCRISGGEQRLVLLARALVKNPPLLILDEPCQGLDKLNKERFNSVLDQVCCQSNKTLIYVTHYQEELPACIHKVLSLAKGKVKECC